MRAMGSEVCGSLSGGQDLEPVVTMVVWIPWIMNDGISFPFYRYCRDLLCLLFFFLLATTAMSRRFDKRATDISVSTGLIREFTAWNTWTKMESAQL